MPLLSCWYFVQQACDSRMQEHQHASSAFEHFDEENWAKTYVAQCLECGNCKLHHESRPKCRTLMLKTPLTRHRRHQLLQDSIRFLLDNKG